MNQVPLSEFFLQILYECEFNTVLILEYVRSRIILLLFGIYIIKRVFS